jgi:hypothetical protein
LLFVDDVDDDLDDDDDDDDDDAAVDSGDTAAAVEWGVLKSGNKLIFDGVFLRPFDGGEFDWFCVDAVADVDDDDVDDDDDDDDDGP